MTVSGDDCTQRNFNFDGERGFVAKETIEARGARSLKAAVSHAPLAVIGDSGGGYTIDVCKAARRAEDLDDIRVTFNDGELKADGPEGRNHEWTVTFKIHAPRNADLNVETENGPLAVTNVDGRVVAHTENGPLALSNVSGDVDASAANGPLSVDGGSGNMKVRAANGPLSVDLDGNAWTGGTLDGATKNGPLSLRIPRGYGSGVVVESRGHGPVSCHAEGCERQRRSWKDDDWDDVPRTIELGSGAQAVRLSTVNGPITIKDE
ncbi:MAG TPA: hypothetical protein VJZ00_23260 [Thermoanaerobaculia bacterium]|nr:hypothetical protein [Thermoanaerobaculia bacterium]